MAGFCGTGTSSGSSVGGVSSESATPVFKISPASTSSNDSAKTIYKNGEMRHEKKLAKMMAFTVILSALCWAPYGLVSFFMIFIEDIPPETIIIVSLFSKFGVASNPFLYVALNKKFMTRFRKMLPFF